MSNSVKKHLVLAVAMTMPGVAFSQALEEVVVTAQKRAQSAQDVPIAITALSGEFLEEWNVLSVTDLQKFGRFQNLYPHSRRWQWEVRCWLVWFGGRFHR
jgi:hypothetical protein